MQNPNIVSTQMALFMGAELARHEYEMKNLLSDQDQINTLLKLECVKIQIRFCESEIERYDQLIKTTLHLDDEENNESLATSISMITQQAKQLHHEFNEWLKDLHKELWEISPTSPLLPENKNRI